MKRFVLIFFLFGYCFILNAAPKTWIGASGGLWSVGTNWSPTGVPASGDDLTFNSNVTINIDAAGPFDVNSMTFTNNSTVVFSTAATRNFRFYSTSTLNPALKIDAGSTFTFDAANAGANNSTLDMGFGGIGVIGSIYGTLNITSSGGSSTGIRLDTYTSATKYAILTAYSGGIIRIGLNTNTTVASLTPTPTFNMLNGSIYETLDNGGSFPAGNWEANSLARALSPGANVPQFIGTTYGNLEWNCPAQNNFSLGSDLTFNNVNLINTKAGVNSFRITNTAVATRSLTINGNLDISSNSKLEITGSGVTTGGGTLNLKGYLNNAGILTTTGGVGTTNDFILNGTSNQNITNTGTFSGTRLVLIMNNSAGATLLSSLSLPANLTLTTGNITTTSANILTMVLGATYSGGSIGSFINGPMKKVGNNDFTFPIGFGDGSGNIYAPIRIINFGGDFPTDEFKAEYKRANPQSTAPYSSAVQSGLDHVSYVEYWTLEQTGGTTAVKKITLDIHLASFCLNMAKTYVSRWNGSLWTNEGSTITSGPVIISGYETGTIQSFNTISGFTSPNIGFTLSTDLPFASNPLPINLISFDATKLTNTRSSLNWELAACCSAAAKFEVQRAGTARGFITIGTIGGSETNKLYNYVDNDLKSGINYYRLKMIDEDGKITYSRTVAVMNGVNGLLLTSLIPTVVTNNAVLTIASSNQQKLDLVIVDMQGRVMLKRNYTITPGNSNIELSLNGLAAGVYQLTGISVEGKTNTIRFIKQ